MARPSQNLDRKLIELGKEKIVTHGISNLSVRQICLDAKINLGMFYYYFKSKENYIKTIFISLNEDMTKDWLNKTAKLSTSEEKLKEALFLSGKMMRENRGMIETILKDVNIFENMYMEIGKELHATWTRFFSELIDECKKDGYLDNTISTEMLIAVLTGTIHNYGKAYVVIENNDSEAYYKKIQEVIDFLMKKFK